MTTPDRFWTKVNYTAGMAACWPWLGSTRHRSYQAHRLAYTLANGPIPDGLTLDHLCRNRACCNPSHLEPVTNYTNIMRGDTIPAINAAKAFCPRGHEYTSENTTVSKRRQRTCKACHREDYRAAYARGWRPSRVLNRPPSQDHRRSCVCGHRYGVHASSGPCMAADTPSHQRTGQGCQCKEWRAL